jgi:hypothetical protein
MTDLERALSDIAFIQQRMAASTRFDGLAPSAVASTGLIAIAAAGAQIEWPDALADSPTTFIAVWTVVAAAAAAVVGSEALARSRRVHGAMAEALMASTLRLLAPFLVTGATITLIVMRVAPAAAWILPGLWQLLIALAGFTAVSTLPRAIIWPAAWYFLTGALVMLLAGQSGNLSPWMMGAPFGIGQLLVAGVLHRAARHHG